MYAIRNISCNWKRRRIKLNLHFFIILLYLPVIIIVGAKEIEKCTAKLDLKIAHDGGYCTDPVITNDVPCEEISVCQKHFGIVPLAQKAYSPLIVSDFINICCGSCANSSISGNISEVSEITSTLMNQSHFVFPVLGRSHAKTLYGYKFLPTMETQNVYYVTHQKGKNMLLQVLLSCLRFAPFLVICLLMVVLSGFICWSMETWKNEEEFPRHFLLGWFEGIWWSFISMTTVGYGDKTPKSIAGRIFSIIWIIMGITTFSFITAVLSSEIHSVSFSDPPQMKGEKVGVLKGHLYETMIIANHGGIIVNLHRENITEGIQALIGMLREETIEGFVIDRYELMILYHMYSEDSNFKQYIDFLRGETLLTEIDRIEELSYGILVKNEEDYEFLFEFLNSNRDVINSCTTLFINNFGRKVSIIQERPSIFDIHGQVFWFSFVSCALAIATIFTVGVVYEIKMKYHRLGRKQTVETFA